MKRTRKTENLIYIALTVIILLSTLISGRLILPAFADGPTSINVINELERSGDFNADDYPYKSDDYGLYVIQVAESAAGNLYLYTYQPCQPTRYLIATEINMSRDKPEYEYNDGWTGNANPGTSAPSGGDDGDFSGGEVGGGHGGGNVRPRPSTVAAASTAKTGEMRLYGLTLVNSHKVFCKYRVNGVSSDGAAERYYNITSIYRKWEKELDGESGNNNTKDKKAYEVGNCYRVTTANGETQYSREEVRTVKIINPYVDYLLYVENGTLPEINFQRPWLPSAEKGAYIDSHYIAFSTDYEIETLRSATVHYEYKSAHGIANTFLGFDCGGDLSYGELGEDYAEPTYKDKVNFTGGIFKKQTYTWDRIQTVAEFKESEKLTEETEKNLADKQWVLRFKETPRTQAATDVFGYTKYECTWTVVERVAVLRLEFETDGVVYNLGAVSDMQTGDEYAGNTEKPKTQTFWDKVKAFFVSLWKNITGAPWWAWLIIGLVVVAVVLPILSIFFPVIKTVLKYILKTIAWLMKAALFIIALPFRGIAAIVAKVRERRTH